MPRLLVLVALLSACCPARPPVKVPEPVIVQAKSCRSVLGPRPLAPAHAVTCGDEAWFDYYERRIKYDAALDACQDELDRAAAQRHLE